MARSQNGYPANDRSLVSSRLIPGTQVHVTVRNGPAGDLLLYAAGRWDNEVEDIDNSRGGLDDWGYAERPIRGGTELSNHASGTAIDLNATKHPLGVAAIRTFTTDQIKTIHRIMADCGGALRWGGDYSGRPDPMHIEVVDTEARCAQVLSGMGGGQPRPDTGVYARYGDRNDRVLRLQQFLTSHFPSYNPYRPTGFFGEATRDGIEEFQRRTGLAADGVVGPLTLAKLKEFGFTP